MSLQEARKKALSLSAGVSDKGNENLNRIKFKDVVPKWFSEKSGKVKIPFKIEERFKTHIIPAVGDCYLDEFTDRLLLTKFKPLIESGKLPTVYRVFNTINEVLRWCVSEELLDKVKTEYVTIRLPKKPPVKHRAALAPEDLGRVIKPGDNPPYLMWSIYSMLRPKENAGLKFEWVDWEKKLLTIPAEEMKMNRSHVVPLTRQMIALLKQQQEYNKLLGFSGVWIWPSTQSDSGHLNPTTLNITLRRMGLKDICSAHGFRATARTYLARIHVPEAVAEACLAHAKQNATVEAYDREQFIEERRKVMQQWCDYVDTFMIDKNNQK